MDLNTSSLFFGEVHNTASTSTPVHKDVCTEKRKRNLIQSAGESSFEPPAKLMRCNFSTDNVSVISIDDETITCDRTLLAYRDGSEFANQEDGAVSDHSSNEKETVNSEDSSRYETVSETYCSDASELSNVSSISNIPLDSSDDSVKHHISFEVQTIDPFKGGKRMIIIDGSNVAFAHSSHRKEFSVEGIRICIDYFIQRGFEVKAVVPQVRLKRNNSTNSELLEQLKDEAKVIISPCKSLPNGKSLISYDDRFILDLAHQFDGAVISNDNFRDLFNEHDDYKRIIQSRIIGYMFCNDSILFPKDPYGRNGPTLEDILHKNCI